MGIRICQRKRKQLTINMENNIKYYAKLLAGCDLPVLEKCKFTVSWSSSEILEIKEVLNSGINILLDAVGESCGGIS